MIEPRPHDPQPQSEDLGFDLPPPAKPSGPKVVAIGLGVVLVCGSAFVLGFLPRYHARTELAQSAKGGAEGARPRVDVFKPKAKQSDRAMTLPGNVQPIEETVIYPRSSGYLRSWKADIGDRVEEGALLAEIDTPEVDQQLAQARAQLAQAEAGLVQAKASVAYSDSTLQRFKALEPKGVVSQQEVEKGSADANVSKANVQVAEANVEAQKANIRRLSQLQSFARVVAPFAGIVNVRSAERGALVSPSTALFKLSQIDTVRVFVQVPQGVAPSVAVGVDAKVIVREFPGRTFDGKVARTAGALDPSARTMNTEVRVPNAKHELLAGMYAQVSLTLASPHRVWELPATAVMTDARGVRVAVVEGGTIRTVPVTIERDNGPTIEIASGIEDGDAIVKLGSATLTDGLVVDVAAP
jgi:RND family efflux transporter MFP subunit